jgi:hypothetical protein
MNPNVQLESPFILLYNKVKSAIISFQLCRCAGWILSIQQQQSSRRLMSEENGPDAEKLPNR